MNPAFLLGVITRTNAFLNSGGSVEASHYLSSIFSEIVENYLWLRMAEGNAEADYTIPIVSLKSLEAKNCRNHGHVVEFLSLGSVGITEAADSIAKAREVELNVRRNRKALIKKCTARD
jgi:hypothetical protein